MADSLQQLRQRTSLTVRLDLPRAILLWIPATGTVGYDVEQSNSSGGSWRRIATVVQPPYRAESPFAWYRVVPVFPDGTRGEPSNSAKADLPPFLLFWWDDGSARWRGPSGQFVSEDKLKRELLKYADRAGQEIKDLAAQLNRGEITLADWQDATSLRVKGLHLSLEAAAKGGFESLTQADYGRIGARLRQQYAYLNRFALDIEAGRQSQAQIVARAGLYANGGAGVYENARREKAFEVYTEERRVLGTAEHCSVCVEEAAKKWVLIGTLRRLGDSPCRANCKCRFMFRKPRAA